MLYALGSLFIFASFRASLCFHDVSFDRASASSTFSSVGAGGDALFGALEAVGGGSGYWCSAGSHSPSQLVTWTGVLNSRRLVSGLKLGWAYGPGEFKVLTSADGNSFEEAVLWRSSPHADEASYQENVMFSEPRSVLVVTVVMKGPRSWGYLGLNRATLISEPGSVMVISGVTSPSGEQCVVSTGSGAVELEPCLDAIAAGDGREVFFVDEVGQISDATRTFCMSVANGVTTDGGKIVMQDCQSAVAANDGRSVWSARPNGQLELLQMGGYCLSSVGSIARLGVQGCSAATAGDDASDKFFVANVPEFDPASAADARSRAALVTAGAQRLGSLVGQLREAASAIRGCSGATALARSKSKSPSAFVARGGVGGAPAPDSVSGAISRIDAQLGVDMRSLRDLLAESERVLAMVGGNEAA